MASHAPLGMPPPAVLWVVADVVGGCVVSALWLDQALAEALHRLGETPIIRLAGWTTHLGQTSVCLVGSALAYAIFRFTGNRRRAGQALFVLLAVGLSSMLTLTLKVLAGRARPKLLFDEGIVAFTPFQFGHDVNSFPSGHATATAAVAVALAMIAPAHRDLCLAVGLMLVSTRVIVQDHYLSDVIAGIAVGIATVHLLSAALASQGVSLRSPEVM